MLLSFKKKRLKKMAKKLKKHALSIKLKRFGGNFLLPKKACFLYLVTCTRANLFYGNIRILLPFNGHFVALGDCYINS